MKVREVTVLEVPSFTAMAFTVVVSVSVRAEEYWVLALVGVEPSVV